MMIQDIRVLDSQLVISDSRLKHLVGDSVQLMSNLKATTLPSMQWQTGNKFPNHQD
jgi:hypothetical protein